MSKNSKQRNKQKIAKQSTLNRIAKRNSKIIKGMMEGARVNK